MIYRIVTCVVHHNRCFKFFNHAVNSIRRKGIKSSKPVASVLAASSNASLPLRKKDVRTTKYETDNTQAIIGVKDNLSSKSDNEDQDCAKHFTDATKKPFSAQDNIFKPIIKPDVTSSAHNYTKKIHDENIDNIKSVKLLNVVKPSDVEWHRQILNLNFIPKYYKGLSKFRLSGLVVITTLAGYGMAPGPVDPLTLFCMTLGTGLTSAAANAINQILEVPYDSQMNRTKNRVLIRGYITPIHAFTFALTCASIGLTTLYFGTTPLTAALGATNLILYTSVYTPLKRCSILNTWLGSVVGAIPPLMGWAACTGTLNSGAFLLGAILYAWQFPHFNALSWNLRQDYSKAGYRMTSVIDPQLCRRTALRYSVLMLVLCSSAPLVELTTWTFAFDSLPLNCYLIYCAWQFYKKGDSQSSRKLFRLSLIHLPALMFLMFVGKKYATKDEKLEKETV